MGELRVKERQPRTTANKDSIQTKSSNLGLGIDTGTSLHQQLCHFLLSSQRGNVESSVPFLSQTQKKHFMWS